MQWHEQTWNHSTYENENFFCAHRLLSKHLYFMLIEIAHTAKKNTQRKSCILFRSKLNSQSIICILVIYSSFHWSHWKLCWSLNRSIVVVAFCRRKTPAISMFVCRVLRGPIYCSWISTKRNFERKKILHKINKNIKFYWNCNHSCLLVRALRSNNNNISNATQLTSIKRNSFDDEKAFN